MNNVSRLVDQVVDSLTQLRLLFDDPTSLPFTTIARLSLIHI